MTDAFDHILGQPQVRDFLRSSVSHDRVSHAYLFTGPAGSNKMQAAYAFAQALVCPKGAKGPRGGACGDCSNCSKASKKKHPDVHFISPEGAATYLVEQIRDVVSDVFLAPIQAQKKIYIFDRVDLMNASTANAFLKTLEEPPDNVVFILLGRTRESVLPTLVSRCQIVPFRHIPPSEAAGIVSQNTGADKELAKQAIEACGGSITRAIAFIKEKGHARTGFRHELFSSLATIASMDDWRILKVSRELVKSSKARVDEERTLLEADLEKNKDLYEKSILRKIEARNQRHLSQKTAEYLHQSAFLITSWLRDVLACTIGTDELVINTDFRDDVKNAALRTNAQRINAALMSIAELDEALDYNVSPETCFDAILFKVREVLR